MDTTKRKAVNKKTAHKAAGKKTAARKTATKKNPASKKKSAPKKTTRSSNAETANDYTKPALRERLKRKIIRGSKGGLAGQWSARKAQLLASEYGAAGGGYVGKKKAPQKSLSKWTKEKWKTTDGEPARRKAGGKKVMARYLPQKAWSELSATEKRATNEKKIEGGRDGRQFVKNTKKAAGARRRATKSKSR